MTQTVENENCSHMAPTQSKKTRDGLKESGLRFANGRLCFTFLVLFTMASCPRGHREQCMPYTVPPCPSRRL